MLNCDCTEEKEHTCPGTKPSFSRDFFPLIKTLQPDRGSRAGYNIGVLGMIWAEDRNHILGADGGMLWHVPADFKHFKETTSGHPIIMGRTSFEALGTPLPNRRNIVLTRRTDFTHPGIEIADSLNTALKLCAGNDQVWITGGGQVYQDVMNANLADLLVVTELDFSASITAQSHPTVAPTIDSAQWQIVTQTPRNGWLPSSGDAAWRVKYYRHV